MAVRLETQFPVPDPAHPPESFFKPYVPDALPEMERALAVPAGFRMTENCPDFVYFVGPSKQRWRVSLVRQRGQYYFKHGWRSFREANKIETGDFLLFTRLERGMFRVEVFGHSMCHKWECFQARNNGKGLQRWGSDLGHQGDDAEINNLADAAHPNTRL